MKFQPSSYALTNASGGTSQNGWPASATAAEIDLVTVSLPDGKSFTATRRAADALKEMALWWADHVEPIKTIYGWNYRLIRGSTTTVSNHGSGTAIDINAADHPLGAEGTVSAVKRALITAKATSLGLRWGGDYNGRKDEMHFEVILPPTADLFRKGVTAVEGVAVKVVLTGVAAGSVVIFALALLSYVKKKKRKQGSIG